MAEAKKAHKPIYRTASPYSRPQVLSSPIGASTATLKKSKGKKSRKWKRRPSQPAEGQSKEPGPSVQEGSTAHSSGTLPDAPRHPPSAAEAPDTTSPDATKQEASVTDSSDIRKHLLLGFNEVTHHLEELSAHSKRQQDTTLRHVAAVFLFRPLDDLIYAHLPTLCYTASLAHPDQPATRLVVLDPSRESKVSTALGKPARVSVVGVLGGVEDREMPARDELMAYVRKSVELVDVPWLREARAGKWLGTKIVSQ
ncbi:RNase P and RNase MRP subunit [Saxophila tyrrhenica]|uniref:RNase P and RNase MRP subunit n=1 Tax=Saxophila tyrrhenica TaxID=1690608 RepID=A0AAV9PQZ6_9PEZI|nr:RNase P and RNase MRP subunit [Saxophila tyrrhenica]